MIPGKTYSPQDVIAAAWRRRWWIAVSFVVFAAVALATVLSLPRSYKSLATIQAVSETVSDAYVRKTATAPLSDRLSSIGQATLTRSRLETIIKDLDLYAEFRSATVMENVIAQMRNDITFKSTDRDVFLLGFTARHPRTAQTVATRLTALFLEENARDRGQRADATTSFLDAQLAEVRSKLNAQETQVEAFRVRHSGELPSQLAFNLQETNNHQQQLRALLESLGRDQDQRLQLQRQLDLTLAAEGDVVPTADPGGSLSVPGDSAAAPYTDPLENARASLRALELRLTPEHPDVLRAQRVIAKLEQQAGGTSPGPRAVAASGSERRRDLRVRDLKTQIGIFDRRVTSAQEEVRRVRAKIDEYARRVEATPLRESELATLTRDYEDTKKQYSSLASRQQEATMAADLERKEIGDRFRVIEPAQLPERPSSQGRREQLLIGLVLALGLSLSLTGLVEFRDSSVRTETDIMASLRLPVLATIPDLGRRASRSSR